MVRHFFFVIGLIVICAKSALGCHENGQIYETHLALFDAFLPTELVNSSPAIKTLVDEARVEVWQKVCTNKPLKSLLSLFSSLKLQTSPLLGKFYERFVAKKTYDEHGSYQDAFAELNAYLKRIDKNGLFVSIADLNKEDRWYYVEKMIASEVNFLRLLGYTIKTFYYGQMYSGNLGRHISQMPKDINRIASPIPEIPKFFTRLQYKSKEKKIKGQVDYLIVGSGVAASIIGYKLQQAGLSVLMVEKGSFIIPGAIETNGNFNVLESKGPRPNVNGSPLFFNAETVGGGSTANMNIYIPPTEPFIMHAINDWRVRGLIPEHLWTDDQIASAAKRVENLMRPRTLSFAHLSENNHLIAQGARRLGVSFAIHQLTTHSPKENRFTVTDKKSNVEQLIIPAMSDDDNPLTLIPNCDVTKVIIKNNQAVGVKCIVKPHWVSAGVLNDPYDWHIPVGTEIDIRANKVVLSAGAFGTTKILLKTKEINNKNIGRGITAHPGFTVVGEFASPIDHDQGAQSGVFVDEYVTVDDGEIKPDFVIETAAGSPALLAVMVPGNPDEVAQGVAHAQFQAGAAVILFDSAQRKNRVALNLRGEPEIYYQLSESDKNRAVEGICKLIELLFAAGATRVSFPTHEDVLGDDDLTEYSFLTHPSQIELVRQNLRLDENKSFVISGHLLGANKLGVDAKTSVVNPEHQVWGVKNLYVVDGGVFPASPHANPMATIFAIADLFAEEQIEKNVKIISEK